MGDLPAQVPLLTDVLAVCDGMVVNVEIKNAPQDPGWDPTEAVASLVASSIEAAGWTERVIVSSFQPATLRAVQVADGRLALGALWGWGVEVGPALRGGRRGGVPGGAPLRDLGGRRVGRTRPMPPGWRSTSGRSTPSRTCGPWWRWGRTP